MKIKIGTKLIVSFLIILIFTAFIGFFCLYEARRINDNAKDISLDWMKKQRLLGDLNGENADYRIYLIQYVFAAYRSDSASSEQLARMAQELSSMLSQFRV